MSCPEVDDLLDFADGRASRTMMARIEAHLDECRDCRDALADAVAEDRPVGGAAPERVDRYEVRGSIGRGAMGSVYEGWDPDLERRIAVKLVATPGSGETGSIGRLAREAQALAAVSHPNIVEVFEVGEHEGELFVAMELIRGTTLREWIAERPPVAEVVDVFAQAAAALDAAHEAGVIHRDFKPDNVMITEDGRVKVLDFGLARMTEAPTTEPRATSSFSDLRLTQCGTVLGTPAYMAPEQHAGEHVGTAGDQFAFCVSLYEALVGKRPFDGATMHELLEAKCRGIPRLAGRRLPARLRRVLSTGLAAEPEQRFASMASLRAALLRTSSRRRWVGSIALPTAAIVVAVLTATPRPDHACDAIDDPRAGSRIAELGGAAYFEPRAEAWAEQWSERSTDACESGDDAILKCLAAERATVHARVAAAADSEAAASDLRSVADSLFEARDCTDISAYGPERLGLEDALSQATVLRNLGRTEQAARATAAVVARAETLDAADVKARAVYLQAILAADVGDYSTALEIGERAHGLAVAARDYDTILAAATFNAAWHAEDGDGLEDGERWLRHAEAALEAVDDPAEAIARLGIARVKLHAAAGDMTGAALFGGIAHVTATAIGERETAKSALSNLGMAVARGGHVEQSIEVFRQDVALSRELYGSDHRTVAHALNNLAMSYSYTRRYDQALEAIGQARGIIERTDGEGHPDLARTYTAEAAVHSQLGRLRDALRASTKAVEVYERGGGLHTRSGAEALYNVAVGHSRLGEVEQTRKAAWRALSAWEAVGERRGVGAALGYSLLADLEDDHEVQRKYRAQALQAARDSGEWDSRTGLSVRMGAAGDANDRGEHEQAEALARAVLDVEPDPRLVQVSIAWGQLARTQHERGATTEAVASLRRGLELLDLNPHSSVEDEKFLRGLLADVLEEQGGNDPEVRALRRRIDELTDGG